MWFTVEAEVFLFGKEIEYVDADCKETAEIIVSQRLKKRFNYSDGQVQIISCKKFEN
tara:strand:- start:35899 stop:36069 length:171 start_codon:yes stop_codon:yes gene_type:complete